jgi:tRNA-splicing ligase RtcB
MVILKGKYNEAKVFTDNIEPQAKSQILELCDQEFAAGEKIRIMPDVHAGIGCTIGTTMTITDKVIPNLVGVDIGCGMLVSVLEDKKADFPKLDKIIRKFIPAGFDIRKTPHGHVSRIRLGDLRCRDYVDLEHAVLSIGTLGGGNHFIEVNADHEGTLYLVIHSGSRHLGKQTAEHYQELAARRLKGKSGGKGINEALAYVQGRDFDDYVHDMRIVQEYATANRHAMAEEIISRMGFQVREQFTTIHNYIDTENMILRKGAISARKGERVIIPINMRDGSLICVGKGNPDWNYSAPHGAGRLMSRRQAK